MGSDTRTTCSACHSHRGWKDHMSHMCSCELYIVRELLQILRCTGPAMLMEIVLLSRCLLCQVQAQMPELRNSFLDLV